MSSAEVSVSQSISAKDQKSTSSCLQLVSDLLTKKDYFKVLANERNILQRVCYKFRNQHGRLPYYQAFQRVGKLLDEVITAGFLEPENVRALDEMESFRAVSLISRLIKLAEKAATLFISHFIRPGFFLPFGVTALALLGRICAVLTEVRGMWNRGTLLLTNASKMTIEKAERVREAKRKAGEIGGMKEDPDSKSGTTHHHPFFPLWMNHVGVHTFLQKFGRTSKGQDDTKSVLSEKSRGSFYPDSPEDEGKEGSKKKRKKLEFSIEGEEEDMGEAV